MKKSLLAIFLLVLVNISLAIFEDLQSGPRVEGMANAFTAVANDVSAIQFNPAGLTQVNNLSVMSFYKLLFGGLGINLHHFSVSAALPLRYAPGTFGFCMQEIGIPMHSERVLTLSHGIELIRDIAFGYNLRGYQLYQRDFGDGFTFGIDFGLLSKIYKRWQVGFYVHNINQPKLGANEKSELPRLLNFGIAYMPTYGITSAFDISKEPGKPTRIMAGQEFEIIENYLTVRAGIQTEPIRFAFGLRTGLKNISVDYALTTHSELPLTHNLGVQINLESRPKTITKKEITIISPPKEVEKPPERETAVEEKPKMKYTIYFDLDKSYIRPDAADVLKIIAQILKDNPDLVITIEGHCCPLGSADYNMALGWQRANAAQSYLIELGVNKRQLNTISYGEERLVTENEVEFWKNRRCEFISK